MPIRPENKKLYPANWKEIRAAILRRAGDCCEFCGIENHVPAFFDGEKNRKYGTAERNGANIVTIVLTIAHLDHDPTHNEPENLKALCQRCHNRYDRAHRNESRKRNAYKDRERDGQMTLKQGRC